MRVSRKFPHLAGKEMFSIPAVDLQNPSRNERKSVKIMEKSFTKATF
jgi:hypothetical protein